MKEWGITISDERPESTKITELKVFTATNIEEVTITTEEGETRTEYHFDMTEYDKDEYIALLEKQVQETQDGLVELAEILVG